MDFEILPEWFRKSFATLNLHVQPTTFSQLKEMIRPMGLGFDVRYLMGKYRAYISTSYKNYITEHETFDGALRHVLNTLLSKIKNKKI